MVVAKGLGGPASTRHCSLNTLVVAYNVHPHITKGPEISPSGPFVYYVYYGFYFVALVASSAFFTCATSSSAFFPFRVRVRREPAKRRTAAVMKEDV